MRILMVENQPEFSTTVVRAFFADQDVLVLPTIATAREAAKAEAFDAVLVDFDLDDGKGSDLVIELRSSGFQGVIIAISSHEPGNQALIAAGANSVCSKLKFSNIRAVLGLPS